MWPNPQFPADLVKFTEEIFNGKLHFLHSESCFGASNNTSLFTSIYQKIYTNFFLGDRATRLYSITYSA